MKTCHFLVAIAVAFATNPLHAQEVKLDGLRIEARVGYETPTISNGTVYKLGNSASIGGELGFDFALSHRLTFGPFANYDYAAAKTCANDDYGNTTCLGSGGNLAAGGRLGFSLGGRAQIYAKAGYDSFRLKASYVGIDGSKTLSGVQGALGFDVNVTRRVYLGAEINYADLGSFAGAHFQRRHAAVTAGARF